ncbi:cleavage and polyadenylation specific factor 5 [Aspergillus luchuensis]|uniref:Cleavage and polyadenylation specific factor 5 n=1 Tax=Aspergillus kawachii TaxID=1069201 RepID=A0A146FKA2_ASPKA|nr:cleavage and polyadenylation specific factor 5 [Aspergillus luchuensis]
MGPREAGEVVDEGAETTDEKSGEGEGGVEIRLE